MMRRGFRYQARPDRLFPVLGLCGRRQRGFSPAADVRTRFAPWVRGFAPGAIWARSANRFEALEPVRQSVHRCFRTIEAGAAHGLKLRHDHGSKYMSRDFHDEIECLGIEASPSFVREPESNGVAERFIRTLKENVLWLQHFETVEELRQALHEFARRYNKKLAGRTACLSNAYSSASHSTSRCQYECRRAILRGLNRRSRLCQNHAALQTEFHMHWNSLPPRVKVAMTLNPPSNIYQVVTKARHLEDRATPVDHVRG